MKKTNRTLPLILTGSAGLILIVILALNIFSLGLLIYRFTLPTDGWLAPEPDDFDGHGFVYHQNIMGVSSGLQPNDWVTAVNNISLDNGLSTMPTELMDTWQAGKSVQYTVQRGEQTLTIDVPLTHWRIGQFLYGSGLYTAADKFGWAGLLIFVGMSFLAFWQRPENPAARALFILAGLFLCLFVTLDVMPLMMGDMMNPWVNVSATIIILTMFSILIPPAFIRLGLVFPRPKPILTKRPWLAYLPYLIGAVVIIPFVMQIFVVGWLWTGTAVLIAIIILLHNALTMRDTVSRGQMRWALGGAILGLGLFSLNYVDAFFVESNASQLSQILISLSGLSFTVIGISLAVAILRFHLFDIDLIINRTLVYGGLTFCVVGIYILVVGYLSFLFQTEANLTISLLATGLVAVLFAPLRNLLQRGINRLMYGERDEPYQVLTRLGQQLESSLDPSSALALTVKTVAQALRLPYAAIALLQEGSLQNIAVYGVVQNEISRFPLIYAGQTIGELSVAARAPNEAFTPADLRLLHDLARQIGVTAHAVRLSANLEQARLRLVTERGEARRQLGSDLHDSIGHQLVGLTQQIENVMAVSAYDSSLTDSLLTDVSRQLVALTTQVRSLAHQLFPPELELLGLAGALREQVQTHSGLRIQMDAPETLVPLPAEIEAAAYYIALEALTNVEKHAEAQTCYIQLRFLPSPSSLQSVLLALDIRDDGCGVSGSTIRGLGLLSMQARAAEVGGTCTIASNSEEGTAVSARIPCPINIDRCSS